MRLRCRCSSRPSWHRTSSPPGGIRPLARRSVQDSSWVLGRVGGLGLGGRGSCGRTFAHGGGREGPGQARQPGPGFCRRDHAVRAHDDGQHGRPGERLHFPGDAASSRRSPKLPCSRRDGRPRRTPRHRLTVASGAAVLMSGRWRQGQSPPRPRRAGARRPAPSDIRLVSTASRRARRRASGLRWSLTGIFLPRHPGTR